MRFSVCQQAGSVSPHKYSRYVAGKMERRIKSFSVIHLKSFRFDTDPQLEGATAEHNLPQPEDDRRRRIGRVELIGYSPNSNSPSQVSILSGDKGPTAELPDCKKSHFPQQQRLSPRLSELNECGLK